MKMITILIPCFNEEGSLVVLYERLRDVIGKLTSYSFQVLLVNDGSRDNTLAIMKELHAKDSRISYLSLSPALPSSLPYPFPDSSSALPQIHNCLPVFVHDHSFQVQEEQFLIP